MSKALPVINRALAEQWGIINGLLGGRRSFLSLQVVWASCGGPGETGVPSQDAGAAFVSTSSREG